LTREYGTLSLGQIISFLSVMIPLRVRMSQSASMYNGKYEMADGGNATISG
jgi:hypothetical protein